MNPMNPLNPFPFGNNNRDVETDETPARETPPTHKEKRELFPLNELPHGITLGLTACNLLAAFVILLAGIFAPDEGMTLATSFMEAFNASSPYVLDAMQWGLLCHIINRLHPCKRD